MRTSNTTPNSCRSTYFPTGPVRCVVSHWWCEDRMGRIVDPTRYQFADKGRGSYLPGGRLPSC